MCRPATIVRAIVTACFALGFCVARAAPAPFLGPVIEVTEELGEFVNYTAEHGHRMHDGNVVWMDDNRNMWLYAGARPPARIGGEGAPSIFGDTVVRTLNGITLYDIPTGQETPVVSMGTYDRAVIHGKNVAWLGWGGPEGEGVFLYDGTAIRKVAPLGQEYNALALDDRRLVWIGGGFNLYDLATGGIVARPGIGQHPSVSGDHLVFEGFFDNPGIFLHDLTRPPGAAVRIADQGHGPTVQGDHVVYSDGEHLQLYTISTGQTMPLGVIGYDPILSGNYLSWGDGAKIFITTIPEPAAIVPLGCLVLTLRRRR
jgi:hypothetical protein